MKINYTYFLLIILNVIIFFKNTFPKAAVTYQVSAGERFGNQLVAYIMAQWCSHIKKIPVLYKEYKYFNKLQISSDKSHHDNSQKFNKVILLKKYKDMNSINPNSNNLYVMDFYYRRIFWQKINWEDTEFITKLRRLIQPTFNIPKINIPKAYISVAVHVRRGGGFDKPLLSRYYADEKWPLTFPPYSYYINQIKKLSKIFKNKKLYCYIFTDDPNPRNIVNKFHKSIKNNNIKYKFNNTNNYKNLVLQDFFQMQQFDCLIKPYSTFSLVISCLKNYKLVISPINSYWLNKKLIISKVAYTGSLAKNITAQQNVESAFSTEMLTNGLKF